MIDPLELAALRKTHLQPEALTDAHIEAAAARACRRIAPLWPLRNFVAVNPFLGLADQPFATAARVMAQRAGARLTAPRAVYAAAIADGQITDRDLAAALAADPLPVGAPASIAELKALALRPDDDTAPRLLPTVADVAQTVSGTAWPRLVTDAISRWAGGYFDAGQAYWPSPWRDWAPFDAWRAEAAVDRAPEIAGVRGFRQTVAALPVTPGAAIAAAVNRLAIPPAAVEAYLHRLLLSVGGWAGHARYRLWAAELNGGSDDALAALLAIRLAWEVALLHGVLPDQLGPAWAARRDELAAPTQHDAAVAAALAGDLLLQAAYDHAAQRTLIAQMGAPAAPHTGGGRKRAQVAFCIDVRSELLRRALETSAADAVETIGFAGFFGFPIEYVRLGDEHGGAQCPALIAPQVRVAERVAGVTPAAVEAAAAQRLMHRRISKAWRAFKFGAVSCFGFVGPVGLAYLRRLVADTLGWGRPVERPAAFGLTDAEVAQLRPAVEAIPHATQVALAEGALRGMSLTADFARLVLLVGHGASSVNNPYASGLDCGACGGHTGEANARVAATILNDQDVRAALHARGIAIPADTWFVAALHDTTTDSVTLYDRADIPASHADDIVQIEAELAAAGQLARAERAPRLQIADPVTLDSAMLARSRDWSQVRPEWGLAGCAAFVVAPRVRTQALNLGGRAFLHSYDWRRDSDFSVLELIMTAPMVVASWISLQYYASTVDNERFGSGNKVLHNVVGTLGVLEGNGGDLRVGLPWQSVHDGAQFVHAPLRLSVLIEAPRAAMTAVLAKHADVRQLLDNGWLFLFALDDDGRVAWRYAGDLDWAPVETMSSHQAPAQPAAA